LISGYWAPELPPRGHGCLRGATIAADAPRDAATILDRVGYQHNPPGIGLMGKKAWLPGKTLARFITANLGITEKEQRVMVERISDAVADIAPAVREMMDGLAGFRDTGKRMLAAWSEDVNSLRDSRMYSLNPWKSNPAFEGVSDPPKPETPRTVVERSELLAGRGRRKSK
jgi:serine/threonine-protein kinase HipA